MENKKYRVIAIIPARGGSKGVPGKNIKLLAGFPLIAYSIAAGKISRLIERVIVSTDSKEIADISIKYGAEVPFLRPAEFSTDKSPDLDFIKHAIGYFEGKEGHIPEYFVHLRPTTPLRDPEIIDKAIEQMLGDPEATCLRSGHPCSESPFKWFLRNDAGYFEGMNKGKPADFANLPRQSFPAVYIPDGYADVIKTSHVIKNNELHGKKMIGFISPDCTEVDTPRDFEYLEYQITKNGSRLIEELKKRIQ